MTTAIDLSKLPAPTVVEPLDFEVILEELKADFVARHPELTDLESDPVVKLLETAAYRELMVRQRVNDAARGVMVAYAGGTDLDHLAALFGVKRRTIKPADPKASPPREAVLEPDDDLRRRIVLSLERLTTAGSRGSYEAHALAPADVRDVQVWRPAPGVVRVAVLARDGDGTPPESLLTTVRQTLNAEDVRPITDTVDVRAAEIVPYKVTATLYMAEGPDPATVRNAAELAVRGYTEQQHGLGRVIARSGLMRALHQPGVQWVDLAEPAADIQIVQGQAPYATAIKVSLA